VSVLWHDARRRWSATRPAPAADLDLPSDRLLAEHHPDHRRSGRVCLRVGPSAGTSCPTALARLLQANSAIDEIDAAAAPVVHTDVVVVGGGGGGCIAALTAAAAGAQVLLASKLTLGDSNTVMAEGGIEAAVGEEDSLQAHYEDTLRAGHFRAVRKLVAAMVSDGPGAIQWLIRQGMSFDLEEGPPMGGILRRLPAGGTSHPRVHAFRDVTGLEMMRVLREAVHLHPRIEVREQAPAVELLTDAHGACAGVVLYELDRRGFAIVRAGAVVLATGGAGRIHVEGFQSSNHFGATADGLVLGYRVGAALADADSFQYHPTGLAWPARLSGQLVSEAVRSAGARLVNGLGQRFLDELHPRDVVAAAILRECVEGRGVIRDGCHGVLLDTPSLLEPDMSLLDRLPALRHLGERAGVDVASEPLLVHPTLHYHNGGLLIDEHGATTVPGLFAAGEVTGGIHGRNRLMGNALLDVVVFGRRAGAAAAGHADASSRPLRDVGTGHLRQWKRALAAASLPTEVTAPILFPDDASFDLAAHRSSTRGAAGRPA
jgi:L-aspartate oxidase